jgi:hypothetical protein
LPKTIWYEVRIFLSVCLGAVPFGLLFYWWHDGDWWILGVVLGGLLVGVPIDRFLDDKRRPLKKIETHTMGVGPD